MQPKLFIWYPYNDGEMGIKPTSLFRRNFDSKKFLFLIKTILINNEIKIIFFLYNKRKSKFKYILQILKLYVWAISNNLNCFNIKFTSNLSKIGKEDIFYGQSRVILQSKIYKLFKNRNFKLALHLSHYEINTREKGLMAEEILVDRFVAETNLYKHSKYFRRYFPYYKKDVYIMPIVAQGRFKSYKDFFKRKNKCIVSGRTIILNNKEYSDFVEFFQFKYQHPMRYWIFENRKSNSKEITNFISNSSILINESKNKNKSVTAKNIKENYYEGFDIVKEFNNHTMFVAPEELNDLPTLTVSEGVACGCVLIATKDYIYQGWGLIPNFHYISYDGSYDDLIKKINYYINNINELNIIAKNGQDYFKKKINSENVTKNFVKFLKEI